MSIRYFGGPILTMEGGPRPEAVLVSGGRITAVGTEEELKALDPGARAVDLEGRALLPAFLDPHSHISAVASTLSLAQLGTAENFDTLTALLRQFRQSRRIPAGEWVIGTGYDHNLLNEGVHPSRHLLDTALPENPCLIAHASGHMGVANSEALRRMGIGPDTRDPEGGRIVKEADGTPSGYLEETAFTRLAAGAMPRPTPEQELGDLRAAEECYLSHGYVLAQDGMTGKREYALLSAGARAGLRLDVVGYADLCAAPELAGEPPVGNFSMGGYKIFLDGSPQGRTAWMSEPYAGESAYRGYPIWEDKQVTEFISTALRDGRQLLAHCNGDAAAEQYLRCFDAALTAAGAKDPHRPVMIHAQLVRRDQLERMGKLEMIPSFFAAHLWYWGDTHLRNFGPRRAALISPLKWAEELGIPFTLHQDSPVIPPDALESVWCAVNRLTRKGKTLGHELAVSAEAALRGVTTHAARQYFMEAERGSIAPGKRADLVILDGDPTAVAPERIRDLRVLETVKGGETMYRQPS